MKKAMVFMVLFLCSSGWAEPILPMPAVQRVPSHTIQTVPVEIISQVMNAPNPFDSRKGLAGKTQISYLLASNYPVQVTIYDLLGMRVRHWDFQPGQDGGLAGSNTLLWDGTNEAGQKVSKGGYLAQIEVEAGTTVATVYRKIGVIH